MAASKTKTAEAGTEKTAKAPVVRHPASVGFSLDNGDAVVLDDSELDEVKRGRVSQWKSVLEQLMVATQEGQVAQGEDGLPKWVRISSSENVGHARATVNSIQGKHLYPGGESAKELFEFRVRIPTAADGKRTSEVFARYVGG